MRVLIDNGHGASTPGKRSPDGRLREYRWAREIAERLRVRLLDLGVKAERIVPEEEDVRLATRCSRVNYKCARYGARNCVLVSIHINAAGNGWNNATGWTGWVYRKASTRSKELARMLYEEAQAKGLQGNRSVPPERYWTAGFYILKNTDCAAVLTENLFMDNRQEVEYLLSEKGKAEIVDLHVRAITKYIRKYG